MTQQAFTYTYSITMELNDKDYVAQFCNEYLRDIEYTSWPEYCKMVYEFDPDSVLTKLELESYEKSYLNYLHHCFNIKKILNSVNVPFDKFDFRYRNVMRFK